MPNMLDMIKKANPEMLGAVDKAVKKAFPNEEENEKTTENDRVDLKVAAALKAVARILAPFKDAITPELLEETLEAVGIGVNSENEKPEENDEASEEGDEEEKNKSPFVKKSDEVSDEHHGEALKMAEAVYKSHITKLGYRMYPDAKVQMKEDEKMEITKEDGTLDLSKVPAEVRPAVEAIYKSNLETVKKNAELEKVLKEERDSRIAKEYVAKAESLKNLGAKTEDVASMLKDVAAVNPKLAETMETVLKAADAQIATGKLFAEKGSSQGSIGSAEEAIEKAVLERVAKSGEKITKEQAYDEFIQTFEGRKLYNEYQKNRPNGI